MTRQQKLVKFLKDSNILVKEDPDIVNHIADLILHEIDSIYEPREQFRRGLEAYMKNVMYERDEEQIESMYAGVLAFLWVNVYGDQYEPVFMIPSEDQSKKWWEFWK